MALWLFGNAKECHFGAFFCLTISRPSAIVCPLAGLAFDERCVATRFMPECYEDWRLLTELADRGQEDS